MKLYKLKMEGKEEYFLRKELAIARVKYLFALEVFKWYGSIERYDEAEKESPWSYAETMERIESGYSDISDLDIILKPIETED